MARKLGTLDLPYQIEWIDRDDWAPVAQEVDQTLGGNLVVWQRPILHGRPITLQADPAVCWIADADRAAIVAMAQTIGASFTLEWDGDLYTVAFRHHEPPAVQLRALFPHGDTFSGNILLMEV